MEESEYQLLITDTLNQRKLNWWWCHTGYGSGYALTDGVPTAPSADCPLQTNRTDWTSAFSSGFCFPWFLNLRTETFGLFYQLSATQHHRTIIYMVPFYTSGHFWCTVYLFLLFGVRDCGKQNYLFTLCMHHCASVQIWSKFSGCISHFLSRRRLTWCTALRNVMYGLSSCRFESIVLFILCSSGQTRAALLTSSGLSDAAGPADRAPLVLLLSCSVRVFRGFSCLLASLGG